MNRMFFHLLGLVTFAMLTSCSSDDERISADQMDGPKTEVGTEATDDFSDLEDVKIDQSKSGNEDASVGAEAGSKDSFSDIESFNEDLIGNELAKEDISTPAKSEPKTNDTIVASGNESNEIDLESADFQSSPAKAESSEPVPDLEPPVTESINNKITNLEYKSADSGGTVIITAEKPIEYQVKEESEFNQVIIEVADVNLPEKFKRPYIAKDFGQPVATINAYQDKGASTARFVIQYKSSTKPAIELKRNSLIVSSAGGGSSLSSRDGGQTDDGEMSANGKNKTVSKRISLQMENVELKEVINLIAEEIGVNIIADDSGLNKKIKIHLRDVPWEEALMNILKAHGLGYVKKDNILRVAPQKVLAEEAEDYLKQVSSQQKAMRNLQGQVVRFFPVNYADVEELSKRIKPFVSKAAKVEADKKSNSIVVSEFSNQMDRIEKILKALDVQPLQIMIEGKIIEASEEFQRKMGLSWSTSTPFTQGSQSGSISNTLSASRLASGLTSTISAGTYDIIGDLSATLQLFENNQKIKILSSPRVVTLNREKALIKQTRQFPIFQVTPGANGGAPLQNTTFKDADLSLEVTPQVTFNGETLMDVKVVRDILGAQEGNARQVDKREAQTKVLVKNGQTMVIGGIYSMDEANSNSGVPLLKDIPVLGYLFKSKTSESRKNELLIFLTPHIVNPEAMRQAITITQDGVGSNTEETLNTSDFESHEPSSKDEGEKL